MGGNKPRVPFFGKEDPGPGSLVGSAPNDALRGLFFISKLGVGLSPRVDDRGFLFEDGVNIKAVYVG